MSTGTLTKSSNMKAIIMWAINILIPVIILLVPTSESFTA